MCAIMAENDIDLYADDIDQDFAQVSTSDLLYVVGDRRVIKNPKKATQNRLL